MTDIETKTAESAVLSENTAETDAEAYIIQMPIVNGEPTSAPKKRRKRAQSAPTTEAQEETKQPETPTDMQVLKCECGADIMPDKTGMYPARCSNCGTWNDYRGIKFLEQSANILVCDKCGGLTLIEPTTTCCTHCGAR